MRPVTNNPYMLADSLFGTYKKDYVTLNGGFGMLLSERLAMGIHLDYLVGDGARIKDPRPSNSIYTLKAFPSVIYSFERMKLGMNLQLLKGREKISYTTLETSTTYRFFRTFGLGKTSVPVNGWSYTRNYYLEGYGGEFQLQYKLGNKNVLTGLGFLYKKEKSEDGSSNPQKGDVGDYKENTIKFYTIINQNKRLNQTISLNVDTYLGTGVEFLQEPYIEKGITYYRTVAELENYSLTQVIPKIKYAIAKPYNDFTNKWEVSIQASADIYQSEYKLEAESSYVNMGSEIKIFKNWFYSKNNFLDILFSGFINYNISNELKQLTPYNASQEIAIWENIIQPDFLFGTANKYGGNVNIRYGRNLEVIKDKNSYIYLDLNVSYFRGTNDAWDNSKDSKLYGFKIGILY